MARWEERDPRWVVETRPDGTNVNGWHWQDKNRFAWAKEKLEQALPELPAAETGNVRITKVTDVVGEAMTSTRKGNKKLAIYDLKITMRWEAQADDDAEPYTGSLQLDDFASHSEPDEYVFTLNADATGEAERRELYKGVVQSLYPAIVETLQRITAEMLDV